MLIFYRGGKIVKLSFVVVERFRKNLAKTMKSIDIYPTIHYSSFGSVGIMSENTPSSAVTWDSLNFVRD